jgi:hypothetical protein
VPVPAAAADGGPCSLETHDSLGKSLVFLYLTPSTDGGSFSPVTIATPFVIRGADFQHFFAPAAQDRLEHHLAATLTE